MIYGIGIDITEIARIEKSIENEKFLLRVFNFAEIERHKSKKAGRASSVAADFCAKEAFSKALGTGLRNFSLKDIEVLRDTLGKPYIKLCGNAEKICLSRNIDTENIFISLSHSKEYAVGQVILTYK